MQLRKRSNGLPWLTLLLLLQRTPNLPFAKNALLSLAGIAEKVWTWKMILPAASSMGTWHALSGATTYVTSSQEIPSSVTAGDSFSFSFYNQGYKAYSYKVENLPEGLSYNNSISGPKITGTLPSAGTYSISITGYRYPGLSGNQTPVYTLTLNVAEEETNQTQTEASEDTETSSSLWSDSNTTDIGNGWHRSAWFGDIFGNTGGWTYHLNHGWLYLHGTDEAGLWIYDQSLGWLYTGKNLFPNMYRNSSGSWLYDQSTSTARKFWDYSSLSSILVNKS